MARYGQVLLTGGMPAKKYIIALTCQDRDALEKISRSNRRSIREKTRARILLLSDSHCPREQGGSRTDEEIAARLGCNMVTVYKVRKRALERGVLALEHKEQQQRKARALDGEQEAHLIALTCSTPPEGQARWSLRLLRERLIEMEIVEQIGLETLRRTLKKTHLQPWLKQMWCIPPQQDARFVAAMEDVLEVYQRPYDPQRPVVCLDEAAKQLLGEVREPISAQPGQPVRYDNEYERCGTCALFMLFEPLAAKRPVSVRQRRTAMDYAQVVQWMCDELYPHADKMVLVQDNLNTHGSHSLYEAFAPEEARRLMERIEWHYTPRHGSWLNMAELELSVLARQCLQQRMHTQENVQRQVKAWQERRNCSASRVNWHFTTEDARIKLKRLYPVMLPS